MASRVSKSFNLCERFLSLSVVSSEPTPDTPSDTVPGGATSPALAFRLYSKGSDLPNNKYMAGQYDDAPLGSLVTPTMPSEVLINAREAAMKVAAANKIAAEAAAEAERAKQAEIDAKIKFADEHMNKLSSSFPSPEPTAPA